jgi:uncharacterized protein (DUF1684 family)
LIHTRFLKNYFQPLRLQHSFLHIWAMLTRMKYLVIFFLFLQSRALSQAYEQKITQHLEAYKQDFVDNPHSPLKEKDLKNLQFYRIDSNYRVIARIEILTNEKPIKLPASSGDGRKYYRYAKANFKLNGKDLQLTIFKSEILSPNPKYKDLLFLPFTDETNGTETYGGGRYLDIHLSEIKGSFLEIDFNKAYNPYCAYSHGYQCPVPPQENDLAIEIKAGEKSYTGKVKK